MSFSKNGEIWKLGDFGSAHHYSLIGKIFSKTYAVTRQYAAPETVRLLTAHIFATHSSFTIWIVHHGAPPICRWQRNAMVNQSIFGLLVLLCTNCKFCYFICTQYCYVWKPLHLNLVFRLFDKLPFEETNDRKLEFTLQFPSEKENFVSENGT